MPTAAQGSQKASSSMENKFWNFIPGTATSPPELLLYGAISSAQSWWEDRVTPAQFNRELADLGDATEIVVRINSGGGDVFAANAIYTRLRDHQAKITVKIDGWAASAATIIAMAGDNIKIARNGVFMIHDPAMTVWDTYRAEDFRKMADELEVIKQSIVNTYAMKTGKDEKEIADLMAEEKWWTGDDAVGNGFCDELMFEDAKAVVENSKKVIVNSVALDVSAYKTLPTAVFDGPKNPGGPTNNMEKPKEEETMEPKNTITTAEALAAAYPDLVNSIKDAAAKSERERIKGIMDSTLDGYEDVAKDAMFENPINAGDFALKITAAERQAKAAFLDGREEDAKAAAGVVPTASEKGGETMNIFDKAIAEVL